MFLGVCVCVCAHTRPHHTWDLSSLMLELKLQSFGHLMQRTDSLGKIEGRRRE